MNATAKSTESTPSASAEDVRLKVRRKKSWPRRVGRFAHPLIGSMIAISGRSLDWTLRHLPLRWVPNFAVGAARCAYVFARRRVEARGLANLAHSFGEQYTHAQRKALLWQGYRGQAICLMESMALSRDSALVRQRIANWPATKAKMQAALEQGRGLIIVGAHFGSWEINNQVIGSEFDFACVAKKVRSAAINRTLKQMRERHGGEIVFHDESPRRLLTLLKQNKIVGIVGDHAFHGVSSMTPPFFGHPTRMPSSPFALARTARAPLMFLSTIRDRDGIYHMDLSDAITVAVDGDREANMYRAMCAWAAFLERSIRSTPEAWLPIIGYWKHELSIK